MSVTHCTSGDIPKFEILCHKSFHAVHDSSKTLLSVWTQLVGSGASSHEYPHPANHLLGGTQKAGEARSAGFYFPIKVCWIKKKSPSGIGSVTSGEAGEHDGMDAAAAGGDLGSIQVEQNWPNSLISLLSQTVVSLNADLDTFLQWAGCFNSG